MGIMKGEFHPYHNLGFNSPITQQCILSSKQYYDLVLFVDQTY